MAVCSLFGNSVNVTLDVVSDLVYTRTGTPTTSTIFNGAKISDHYRPDLPSLNITGVVTFTKIRDDSNLLSPAKFDSFIDDLMESQTLLTFIGTTDQAIKNRNNVVIASYSSTRNVSYSDSLKVTLTLQQLDISNAVQKTTISEGKSSNSGLTTDKPTKATEGKTTENTSDIQKTAKLSAILAVTE